MLADEWYNMGREQMGRYMLYYHSILMGHHDKDYDMLGSIWYPTDGSVEKIIG